MYSNDFVEWGRVDRVEGVGCVYIQYLELVCGFHHSRKMICGQSRGADYNRVWPPVVYQTNILSNQEEL